MSSGNKDGSVSIADLRSAATGGLARALGLVAWTIDPEVAGTGTGASSNPKGSAVWLLAGTVITYLAVPVTVAGSGMTDAQLGIVDANMNLVASTPSTPAAFNGTTGWIELALSAPYTVPADGVYYLVASYAGTTKPSCSSIAIAGMPSATSLPGGKRKTISYGVVQGTLPNPWVPVDAGLIPVIVAR